MSFYEESGGAPEQDFWHGTGCNFCDNTGYQDRIGVYELLQIMPEVKRLILGWAAQDELRPMDMKQGMRTLREDLVGQDIKTISRSHAALRLCDADLAIRNLGRR